MEKRTANTRVEDLPDRKELLMQIHKMKNKATRKPVDTLAKTYVDLSEFPGEVKRREEAHTAAAPTASASEKRLAKTNVQQASPRGKNFFDSLRVVRPGSRNS